jgi:uncharacterized protein
MRIGLVSDLHGRFDPRLPKVLEGVERILLAGDIVEPGLMDRLRRIAPVDAVRGNNDQSPVFAALPEFLRLELAGIQVMLAHDRRDRRLPAEMARQAPDVLVVGHSHKPLVEQEGALLVVNPGSAGPKRFSLPRTAGTMQLVRGRAPRVSFWDLENDCAYRLPKP